MTKRLIALAALVLTAALCPAQSSGGKGGGGVAGISGGNPVTLTNPVANLKDQGSQVFNITAYSNSGCTAPDVSCEIMAAVTAAATNGGLIYFPPGIWTACGGAQISIPSLVYFYGTGQGNSVLKACSTMSPTAILVESGNWNTTNCQAWISGTGSSAQYTSCPYDFGIFDMTIDGNVAGRGIPSSPSTQCQQNSSTTNVCAAVAFRGLRFHIWGVDVINSPWDGVYREMAGAVSSPSYNGQTALNNGNKAIVEDSNFGYNTNNGETAYGPPDSMETRIVAYWNGCVSTSSCASTNGLTSYGQLFGCLPASAGAVCAANNYLQIGHNWHNYNWGYEIETPVQMVDIQSETNQSSSGGCGIHVTAPGGAALNNFGLIQATGLQLWNNQGTCNALQLDSPPSTYTVIPTGNVITGLWDFANLGGAIGEASTAAGQTHIHSISNQGNTTGVGASPADGVLLCFVDVGSPIVGNSAAQNIFTCTIPALWMQPGHIIDVKAVFSHSTGSASVTYAYTLGGVATPFSWSSTQANTITQTSQIHFTAASTALMYYDSAISSALPGVLASTAQPGTGGTFAPATNADAVLAMTFNVANTDQVRPQELLVTAY